MYVPCHVGLPVAVSALQEQREVCAAAAGHHDHAGRLHMPRLGTYYKQFPTESKNVKMNPLSVQCMCVGGVGEDGAASYL